MGGWGDWFVRRREGWWLGWEGRQAFGMISVWSDYGSVIARHPRSETLNEASKLHHRPRRSCNERERGQEPEQRFGFGRQFESNRRESY